MVQELPGRPEAAGARWDGDTAGQLWCAAGLAGRADNLRPVHKRLALPFAELPSDIVR